jgi:succinoglycan biosynthesis protein ExoM
MLTYRRPDDLAQALPIVATQATNLGGEVLVVDNDPDGSARELVAAIAQDHGGAVRYVHEPVPGISAARNRGLDETVDADAVVFVDDDERPVEGWLDLLVGTWRSTGAAAVVGPVVSHFASPVPGWVEAGRFFDRRRLPTGTFVDVAATNNLLLDAQAVRALGLRFDEGFGLSGGSDTLFTRSLVASGARMVWCDEAVVTDVVPASRATREWVLHRAVRSGNSAARCDVALAGPGVGRLLARGSGLLRGAARVVVGALRSFVGRALGSQAHDARGRRTLARGLGMISGAAGRIVFDYARS